LSVPTPTARAAARAGVQLRGAARPGVLGGDDLPDPYGKQTHEFEHCADATATALEKILPVLFRPTT
jgi:protein-tyrosine-phosphatase